MNVVSYGGGTDSTAMLIQMHKDKVPVDLILFADTGCEMPHTYKYIEIFSDWLKVNGMPEITTVCYKTKDGERLTLEAQCLQYKALPSIAYGFKQCSVKHKIGPQDKFCNNYDLCQQVWSKGEKVSKFVGYDAGEERRKANAFAIDLQDKKYQKNYYLIDNGIYREDCISIIKKEGLPLPGKSSCFFCPSMKKKEIRDLRKNYPELFERALQIERNAKDSLLTVKGLGRSWAWEDYINDIEGNTAQVSLCGAYPDSEMPCGCYDGD